MKHLIAAAILTISTLAVAESTIPLGQVPAPITKAFAARYPKLTVTKAARTKTSTYELAAEVSKDDKTEATFTADGTFLEEETIVPVASLPAPVAKAFAAKYPKAKADRAEKQTKADKTITFEIAFASQTGKGKTEATFKDDGTFVEQE